MPEYPYEKIEEPRRKAWIWVLVVLIMVVAGVLVYLGSIKEKIEVTELEIEELKFCSYIDEEYNCEENPDAVYPVGSNVYIYLKLKGFSQIEKPEGWLIAVKEDIRTIDPNGEEVVSLTGTIADLGDYMTEKSEHLQLKNVLHTSLTDVPGEYAVVVLIKDKIDLDETSKIVKFILQ